MNGNLFNNNFLLGFAFLGQRFEDQQSKFEIALAASQLKPGFSPGIIALKQRVDSHAQTIEELNSRTTERDNLVVERDVLQEKVRILSEGDFATLKATVQQMTCPGPNQLRFKEEDFEDRKIGGQTVKFSTDQIIVVTTQILPELLQIICDELDTVPDID